MVATQGRSFWILDDIAPLRQISKATVARGRPPLQALARLSVLGRRRSPFPTWARTPPNGALVYYSLKSDVKEGEEIVLEIEDAAGKLVRKFSSKPDPKKKEGAAEPRTRLRRAGPHRPLPGQGRPQPLRLGPPLSRGLDLRRHDPLGRRHGRPGGRPRDLPGEAHGRRDHRPPSRSRSARTRASPPPPPTSRSSSSCR